jgi:BMFP domain-containing protein YqiC
MVVTEVRKYMEAALEKLSPAKAQEMARSVLKGEGKGRGKEQVQKVAQDLMDWSNHTRSRMKDMVRREVARQIKSMGAVTKDDLDALKARIRVLERDAGAAATAPKSSAKKAATTARRSATGASTARTRSPSTKPTTTPGTSADAPGEGGS